MSTTTDTHLARHRMFTIAQLEADLAEIAGNKSLTPAERLEAKAIAITDATTALATPPKGTRVSYVRPTATDITTPTGLFGPNSKKL
ncbi:MAG: hypothetical protein H2172_15760 [Opitutus sp.]|nr:hypothetical protein [Opitutus sp.]MCS6246757.1 hypothetical protein [Opitutus sp.]MCS6273281.1 hypothetical protein [Opitutus sp.]MCS6276181.1 hypothetical protein [Opitutus sp.]MCS6301275.1 hypothetical protein [Opitutus sp.]